MMWLPWSRRGLGCGMAVQGGLVTCESLVTAGMMTVGRGRVGAGLFEHFSLICHKHILS